MNLEMLVDFEMLIFGYVWVDFGMFRDGTERANDGSEEVFGGTDV